MAPLTRRLVHTAVFLFIALSCGLTAHADLAPLYQVTDLGTLGGNSSIAFGINDLGQIVGSAAIAGNSAQHAFVYSNGTMTDLGALGGNYGIATAINNLGQVVGIGGNVGGPYQAFVYSGRVMTPILTGLDATPYSINDSGQIVGNYLDGQGNLSAFLYSNGQLTDLGSGSSAYGINNSGQIVGVSQDQAFRTASATPIDLTTDGLGTLGGSYSEANAINSLGQVVGVSPLLNGGGAFLTSPGSPINPATDGLGTLYPGGSSEAWAINNLGQVVGEASYTSLGAQHAFIYTGNQMYDLNNLILPGSDFVSLTVALGINDLGQIVGEGTTANGDEDAFLLTPVPEPSTLNIVGLVAVCWAGGSVVRRKCRSLLPVAYKVRTGKETYQLGIG